MANLIKPPVEPVKDKKKPHPSQSKNHIKYVLPDSNKNLKKEMKRDRKYQADAIKNYPVKGDVPSNTGDMTVGNQLANMINEHHNRQFNQKDPSEHGSQSNSNYSELDVKQAREARFHILPTKSGIAHSKEFAA